MLAKKPKAFHPALVGCSASLDSSRIRQSLEARRPRSRGSTVCERVEVLVDRSEKGLPELFQITSQVPEAA
jgi:hypothetical protein